jgi:prepilin-type N-terminal cleavage/methylation domain-containing protein
VRNQQRPTAFTLIELLIVVAIIAILAAIAVPNFLEAQTRAKVSRIAADMRSLATAIEAYQLDHGTYPPSVRVNLAVTTNLTPGQLATPRINALVILTTPVSYISSAFPDVFNPMETPPVPTVSEKAQRTLSYWGPDFLIEYDDGSGTAEPLKADTAILLQEIEGAVTFDPTVGPSAAGVRDPLWATVSYGPDLDYDILDSNSETTGFVGEFAIVQPYDSTNGTTSDGDILRLRE